MNKTITTPKGKVKVELKEDINGYELEEIQKPITDIRMELQEGGKSTAGMNIGEAKRASVHKAIEIIVQSVAGEKENVLEKVLALSAQDFTFVCDAVDEVASGGGFLEKGGKQNAGTGSEN